MPKSADKTIDQMTLEEYMAFEDSLRSYAGADRVVSSEEVALELAKRTVPFFSAKVNMPSLDRMLDGVEEGELCIITGPTGHGKTTTAFHFTRELAKAGTKALWFSYEMSYSQLLNKITPESVFEFYMPREIVSNHIDFIEKKIMEAQIKHNIRVIFIDHLSMLYSLDKYAMRNVSLELGDIVAKIKNMCLRHGVVIFLLAHTKKIEAGVEIFLEDLRDSGMIANLADIVLTVQRVPNEYKDGDRRIGALKEGDSRIRIKVEKNRRRGTRGSLIANYDQGIITELDRAEYDKDAELTRQLNRF